VTFDKTAQIFIRDTARRTIRFVANEPDSRDRAEYSDKLRQVSRDNDLADPNDVIFIEITVTDPSEFASHLDVTGETRHGRYRVLTLSSSTVPNALAALLLVVRDRTDRLPHIYFEWTEGNPAAHLIRFLFFGVGEVAPVAREVIRRAEPDRDRRPYVHVG
ncbi:MAG TPA: amino acid transporter, partial [Propionibacteriaceae bacterium]|nr:amino acid transporter [Propionibacteriaceae bacterium]